MPQDTYLKKVLGVAGFKNLRESKILLVGAGGIGCELLKDLILMGYGEIHVVDLDTVTLSNLNRQFLFRKKDIKKSKSLTCINAVKRFNFLNSELVAYHGSIMDAKQFPLAWFDQFTLILNALDNVEARTYVNKMCLFLQKPLMESGTTGFNGHVQPIYPYRTECFDCTAKETPKTFPVCTIRSTPSQPAHCITWAKNFLFQQLFDESDSENLSEQELSNETDDKKEIENLLKESNELNELRNMISKKEFIDVMIDKIFKVDIERLLQIESLWKTRKAPIPLNVNLYGEKIEKLSYDQILGDETKVLTIEENLKVLIESAKILQKRLNSGSEKFLTFDKDDDDTLNFVVASSNIRSYIFDIEIKSKFDIKQIAGNIIPAIATTNATIAGFSALQSLNFLWHNKNADDAQKDSKMVFTSNQPNKFVSSSQLFSNNEKCGSCSVKRGLLKIPSTDTLENTDLSDLISLIEDQYKYGSTSVILGKNKLIYDFDFDDNLKQKLSAIGFKDNEILLINDEDDELESVELCIQVVPGVEKIQLPNITIQPKARSDPDEGVSDDQSDVFADENGDDDLVILDDLEDEFKEKRKAETKLPEEPDGKKPRTTAETEENLIVLG